MRRVNFTSCINIILLLLIVTVALVGCNSSSSVDTDIPQAVEVEEHSSDLVLSLDSEAVAASEGDSATVIFTAYPLDSCQECTWALTLNESEMTNWLCNRVKDKLNDGKEYISLAIVGNQCTVTALEFFKYGIKYTTYWTLTATSTENPQLTASCSIQLG